MDIFSRIYTNIILGDNVIHPYGFGNPFGIVVFKQRLWNMVVFFNYSLRFLSV